MNGGRYDRLLEEFGTQLCATGFAVEITKLMKAYSFQIGDNEDKCAVVYCSSDSYLKAVELCAQLRSQGKRAVLNLCEGQLEFNPENSSGAQGQAYWVCGGIIKRVG